MSRPYTKMRASGVEWLGEVPEHWGGGSLRWISKRYSGGTPDKANQEYWKDGDIPWLNSGAVNDGYITTPSAYISREGFANSSAKWIPMGSLVLALAGQGKTKGMVAQLGIETTCNQSMAAIIPSSNIFSRFLYWWLSANYQNIRNLAGGDLRDGLNLEIIGSIPCPLCPKEEQGAIASFLDRKTALIDDLIAKREHQIELLQEQRTALISRAVTKGLEPDVPMKDSGVEWLGKVPEHWGVMRLKQLLIAKKGAIKTGPFGSQLLSSEMVYGDIKVYNQKNVISCDIDGGDNFVSSEKFEDLRSFEVFPGDLLITSRGTIGRCIVVPEQAKRGILHPCLMRVQIEPSRITNRFLEILIQDSGCVLGQLQLMSNATTIDVIYSESLKEVWLPVPPVSEQDRITTYLDRETAKIDAFVAKVYDSIEKLREYRQSLISAAVTGKINVRGWQSSSEPVEESLHA